MTYKELIQKIIDTLKADPKLKASIKKFYFGLPVRLDTFPCIYVKWIGGPIEAASIKSEQYIDRFHIVVIDRYHHEDAAEKSVMDKTETIDGILDANPTLDGLVQDSWLINVEAEATTVEDYAVSGVRLTLESRRIKN